MKKPLSGRIWALDLLKCLAIFGVVLHHFANVGWSARPIWRFVFQMSVNTFLLVSGITFSLACIRYNATQIGVYYKKKLLQNMWRILWPYTLLFCAEVYYHSFFYAKHAWIQLGEVKYKGYYTIPEMLALYPAGGLGAGAYYITYLVAIIVAFPLLYWLCKKCWWGGLALCVVAYLLGEFFARPLRSLLMVYVGIVLVDIWNNAENKPRKILALKAVVTAASLLLRDAGNLLIAAIVVIALLVLPRNTNNLLAKGVSFVGKASFDVFLVQKVLTATYFPPVIMQVFGITEWALVCVVVACGLLFYLVETNLLKLFTCAVKRLKQKEPQKA